jgi:Spy/CpxP family protein refolding chaperone
VKFVRALIAAAVALGAAVAVQMATSSGASASIHPPTTDCGNCWEDVHE